MKQKILIVEDEIELAQIMGKRARHRGYVALFDYSGENCLTLAREQKPALVLIDMNLPKVNGLWLIRYLKQDPALSRIPIIVFSALHEMDVIKAAIDLGANAYFTKSGELEDLFDVVGGFTNAAPLVMAGQS